MNASLLNIREIKQYIVFKYIYTHIFKNFKSYSWINKNKKKHVP